MKILLIGAAAISLAFGRGQKPADDPRITDAGIVAMSKLVGGTWRGEVKDASGKVTKIEFKYRRHPDGFGVLGEGIVGKGAKNPLRIRSAFGWDPLAKATYYLDCHNSDTVYWGHVSCEGDDVVFTFGPAGGDPKTFSSRLRFRDANTYVSVIRDASGKDMEGFTMRRS